MPTPAAAPASLRILPIASALNPYETVRDAVGRTDAALRAHAIDPQWVERAGDAPDALFVVTGGTEHLALEAIERGAGPAILNAHLERNSLPAALEILGRVRQVGRRGRIFLLNDRPDGFASLARVAGYVCVRQRLASARLGRIGAPSDWLVASTPDAPTVAAAWGPEVVDVPMAAVFDAIARADPADAASVRRDFESSASRIVEPAPADLDAAARVAAALRLVVAEQRLDACSVRCFDLVSLARTTGCLALSWLSDHGVVAGCEGDVPAAITMLWMEAMTGGPSFMANPQDVDAGAGTVDLAHCTIARRMVSAYSLRSHSESSIGVGIEGTVEPGEATVARVGGGDMRELFVSDASVLAGGDNPQRCRTQLRVRLACASVAARRQPSRPGPRPLGDLASGVPRVVRRVAPPTWSVARVRTDTTRSHATR